MTGVLDHDSAIQGYTQPGTTWANEMNIVMNHAPGAGSIARLVYQQSSTIPLCYGDPWTRDSFGWWMLYNFLIYTPQMQARSLSIKQVSHHFYLTKYLLTSSHHLQISSTLNMLREHNARLKFHDRVHFNAVTESSHAADFPRWPTFTTQ